MKIAFVVPGMGMGGAERVISILSRGLAEKGHGIFIGMFNITQPKVAYPLDERVEVEYIKSFRFNSVTNIRRSFDRLAKYLKRVQPDVVISFTNVTCAQVSMVCKRLRIPVIFSERNDPRMLLRGKKEKFFQHILVHNVRNMVFQTKGAQGLYPKQIHSEVILNPLDTSRFPAYFEGQRRKEIVTVGRLEPQKRQDILIHAFARIADRYPEYVLRIYGEGTQREALSGLINRFDLNKRVLLMGTRNDIFERINDAAVFVLTSDFEGLPNALIEAMALGLPCVSTRCSPGGAEEVIEDGKNGFLVPCGDIEALATKLIDILEHEEDSKKVGLAAMQVRARVNRQEIINSWESYIDGVVKGTCS